MAPGGALLLAAVWQEFVDASEHQRHDARRKAADDHTRCDQRERRGADGGEQDRNRRDQEGKMERRAEAGAVAKMAGEQGADDGAEAIQHPVLRAGGDALAEAARDEIDEEKDMRHEAYRVEAVLNQQGTRGQRLAMMPGLMRRGL